MAVAGPVTWSRTAVGGFVTKVVAIASTRGMMPLDGSNVTLPRSRLKLRKKFSDPPVDVKVPASVGALRVPPSVALPLAPMSTLAF